MTFTSVRALQSIKELAPDLPSKAWRFLTRHRADAQRFEARWLPVLH